MMKKSLLFLTAAIAFSAFACSDDKPEVCSQNEYQTHCDGTVLVFCNSNNRIVEEDCPYGCEAGANRCRAQQNQNPSDNNNGNGSVSRPSQNEVEDGCNGIDAAGICDNNYAVRCISNKLVEQKCENNTVCGKKSDGNVDCIAKSTNDNPAPNPEIPQYKNGEPCNGIDEYGICSNNQAIYCDNGSLVVDSCDKSCIVDDVGFANCYKDCPSDLDGIGKCENETTAVYCHDEKGMISIYCNTGYTCQHYKDSQWNYYSCFKEDGSEVPHNDDGGNGGANQPEQPGDQEPDHPTPIPKDPPQES